MLNVIETPVFQKYAADIWSDTEREAFINWLSHNPDAGDAIPGTAGLRKVRWVRKGIGKPGGARVIYFNRLEKGEIWLLIVYAKTKFDNLPPAFLNQLKEEINDG